MNTTVKQLRKLFLLICLITAGVQSAWGDNYFWVNDVQYYIFKGTYTYVEVVSYTGDAETLTIPASVSDGSNTYSVKDIKNSSNGTPVDISSVRTLIIEGNKSFLKSSGSPTFNCPNLEKIIFKGDLPTLTNSFNDYFGTRRGIIAYVTGKTVEEVEQLKNNTAVWCDFEDIVIYHEGDENLEGTAAFIPFKDDNVKALCVANWDTNGDGKISMAEAAAVTSLGTVFKWNTDITSFNELQYFTGLTKINSSAFALCSNLASVILPETLTEIEHNAFEGCKKLTSIVFPEGLTAIGYSAFYNCDIKSVFIPASVESIGTNVFGKCRNLTSIVVDDANTVFDSRGGCDAIIVTASNTLKEGCRYTVIPNSVTAIYTSAFRDRGVPELVIPESVTSIGDYAFMCMNSTDNPTYYLKRMEVKWETPLQVDSKVFGTESANYPKQCTLVVPYGCSSAYSSWAQYFKEIVEAEEVVEPSAKPVWTISKSDDCPTVELQSSSSSGLLTENFTKMSDEIDPSSNYRLIVYKGNEGRPIRVIKNGVDVGSEFSSEDDGAFYFDMDPTADEAWEISYVPQRKLHFKTTGSPKNVAIYHLSDVTNGKNIAGINTTDSPLIDRIDLLNEGVTYRWRLLGPTGKNFKRVTIDGEEVQLTDGTNVSLPYITLGRFDVDIVVEFTEDFIVNAYATNDARISIASIKPDDTVESDIGANSKNNATIDALNYVKVSFTAAKGDVLRSISYGKYCETVIDETDPNLQVETLSDGRKKYTLTLAKTYLDINAKPINVFAIIDKPDSMKYDVNGDGEINITDVTVLVNKILHP